MNYVVAVSGGVDSVVLLNKLARAKDHRLVVAHFDHGIRAESADDAAFVRQLAKQYGLPFELGEGNLGEDASEEQARDTRYAFLRNVAERHDAMVVTAHHQDDIIETIAINVSRGTGWRGLAVLDSPDIHRPLLGITKRDIYKHALKNNLEWVEDGTNQSDRYLRNRIRKKSHTLTPKHRRQLLALWESQRLLKHLIDTEADSMITSSRYFISMIDEQSASEIVRSLLEHQQASLTRPQRQRLVHAIKVARTNTVYEAGGGVQVSFTAREFIVKHP